MRYNEVPHTDRREGLVSRPKCVPKNVCLDTKDTSRKAERRIEGRQLQDKTRHIFYCYGVCICEIFMLHQKL